MLDPNFEFEPGVFDGSEAVAPAEHLRIQGRKTWYEDLPQPQADLDAFLKTYNHDRPRQGRGMKGRTPIAAFLAGIKPQPESESQTTSAA